MKAGGVIKGLLPDFHYDASNAGSITLAGGTVSQINDLGITASRHLTQSIASQRPVYGTRNGRAALIFDGSNDILLNNTNAGTIGVTSVTFFLVGAFITGGATEDIPLCIGVTEQGRQTRSIWRPTSSTQLGFGSFFNDVTTGPLVDAGGASHLWEIAQSGQQVFQTRDGVNQATYPATLPQLPLPVNATGISIGSMQGGAVVAYYTNIAVHEVVGFYSFLTESERLAYRAQLMSKWVI
jgi:hypothetical protein